MKSASCCRVFALAFVFRCGCGNAVSVQGLGFRFRVVPLYSSPTSQREPLRRSISKKNQSSFHLLTSGTAEHFKQCELRRPVVYKHPGSIFLEFQIYNSILFLIE